MHRRAQAAQESRTRANQKEAQMILKREDLATGYHDAEPLFECLRCKAWFAASHRDRHEIKCSMRMVKDIAKAIKF